MSWTKRDMARPMKTPAARLKSIYAFWQASHCVPARFESTGGALGWSLSVERGRVVSARKFQVSGLSQRN
jgi:hypothetical protein